MSETKHEDQLTRFMLAHHTVRGELVRLGPAWRDLGSRHNFPTPVLHHLGELSAAGLLLAASLKFDGTLILQIHGDGPVALLVVECNAQGVFRATAKMREGQVCPEGADLQSLVNTRGQGRFVVTLDPGAQAVSRQLYQGIVPFEGQTIAEMLERYMERSEQVPTRLWICSDSDHAAGLLLQRLAGEGGHTSTRPSTRPSTPEPVSPRADDGSEDWNRMQLLGSTLQREELLTLSPEELMHRLFWQEGLTQLEVRQPRFRCTCTRSKVANMLRMLGQPELESILAEQEVVEVRCEFCNQPYQFDPVDSAELFIDPPPAAGSRLRH